MLLSDLNIPWYLYMHQLALNYFKLKSGSVSHAIVVFMSEKMKVKSPNCYTGLIEKKKKKKTCYTGQWK